MQESVTHNKSHMCISWADQLYGTNTVLYFGMFAMDYSLNKTVSFSAVPDYDKRVMVAF